MATLKDRLKKVRRLYYMYREVVKLRDDRKRLWKSAKRQFEEEQPQQGSLADYKRALRRHRVSYKEYMHCYKFWGCDEKQRDEFISDREMHSIYRKTVEASVNLKFKNKVLALRYFEKYIHRRWLYSKEATFDSFVELVQTKECLFKPVAGSLGEGIRLIKKDDLTDLKALYNQCCEKDCIVEEKLSGCKELAEFHPGSLNTLRVLTVSKGGRCEVVASMLRVGVGDSLVDNASAGGIVSFVDVATGTIVSDGADKLGNKYVAHPESGKVFKGFVIPHWEQIVDACKSMSLTVPELVFAGWDLCVLQDGSVELVEVNSYSNVSGLQTAYGRGIKPRLRAVGKEVLGYDPVKLVSVWSRSYVRYEGKYGFYVVNNQ